MSLEIQVGALSVRGAARRQIPSVHVVAASASTLFVRDAATGASAPNAVAGTGSSV
eukprot:CAMPEP_0172739666 /NCGR_PEP_ID=MMETSP1074-20121228/123064_1 /TAXON_ID=2916 /ORGANISM="Ceratium fusus, Strain PA161109" /LENGTH=55 /DNA_ID=CAMNT_0013569595 /DNA_START=100 /DNA_END=267 /DNA_ORIENTATION=-